MANYDLKPYCTTFKTAIHMAEDSYREYKDEFDKQDTDGDGIIECNLSEFDIHDLAIHGKEKELFDFLNSLDYEIVKALQVIMYIGRDTSCLEDDGTYSYEKSRKTFDKQGWNEDKSIEVNQMVEKVQLSEYLKQGFEKLKIVL